MMNAHVLLNLLNELTKMDKMRGHLSLFVLMNFPIHIYTISMKLSILIFKVSQVEISKFLIDFCP